MKNLIYLFCFLYLSHLSSAQEVKVNKLEMEKVFLLEKYIYEFNFDSIELVLNQINVNNEAYFNVLKKIIDNKHSNSDIAIFLDHSLEVNRADKKEKNDFIEKKIRAPHSINEPDFDYVNVRIIQHLFLMNSNLLQRGNEVLKATEEYVNSFDSDNSILSKKIDFLLTYSHTLYSVIKRDVEKGEKLANRTIVLAREIKDTCMMIKAGNSLSEFLIYTGDLNKYISLMDGVIDLGRKQKNKCSSYYVSVFNQINAKIYRGDANSEIIQLIEELYENPRTEFSSYYCIIEFLSRSKKEVELEIQLKKDFNVNSTVRLIEEMLKKSRDILFPNDYYQLMRVSSDLLKNEGQFDKAFDLKDESVSYIKTIYSKDLSNAIAESEISQVEKEKEFELSIEKEKVNKYWYYFYLLIGIIGVIAIAVFVLRKKNLKLIAQKNAIEKKDGEKQLLLKEIHHRVKNNFQIVSSLLQLQTKGIDDENALSLAKDGQNRVKAMSLIHQKLYQNEEMNILFSDYITSLVRDINTAYSSIEVNTNVQVDESYSLDIDTAIPLGIILNELITNSFKYAFSPQKNNEISIELRKGELLHTIIYQDNGNGLEGDVDFNKMKSIGLKLTRSLAKQLHGNVTYMYKNGAQFIVTFKETESRELID